MVNLKYAGMQSTILRLFYAWPLWNTDGRMETIAVVKPLLGFIFGLVMPTSNLKIVELQYARVWRIVCQKFQHSNAGI